MSKKNTFRKYAVATMAVATASTAVIPAAVSADTKKGMSDVSTSYDHYDDIKALLDAGHIKGYPDGTFRPENPIKRKHVAPILRSVLDLEVPEDVDAVLEKIKDVDSDNEQADDIAAVVAADIFKGSPDGYFKPEEPITREQMANVLVIGFGLKDIDAGEKADIDLVTVGPDHKDYVQVLANLGITNQTGKDGKKHYRGGKSITRGQFATFVNLSQKKVEEAEKEEVDLAVESVSAINATQVEVKFAVKVDKDVAEDETNYEIGDTTASTAELADDGQTVTLNFGSSIEGYDQTVEISPITTAADQTKETEKYVGLLNYKDTVKPTVSTVTAKTGTATVGSVTVKFSEPVAPGATFKVNGNTVAAGNVSALSSNDTEVTLSGLALEPSSTNTLEVIALTDKAIEPNITVSQKVSFVAEADTDAPQATVEIVSDKFIDLTFNKEVDPATVTNGSVTLAGEDGTPVTLNPADVAVHPEDNGSNTKFRVTLPDLYTSKDSRTLTLTLTNTITDTLGNKLDPVAQTLAVSKDKVKPTVTTTQFVKDKDGYVTKIILNYSEELAAGTPSLSGVQVVDSEGRENTSVLASASVSPVSAGDKKVEINVPAANKVETGSFNISLPKEFVTDNSHGANKSAAQTVSVTFGSEANAFVIPVGNISSNPVTNVITVNFGEPVKGGNVAGSATDRTNYKLDGNVLPEGTKIVLNPAGTEATITLPESDSVKVSGDTPFAIEGVQNTKGVTNTTVATTVGLTDNTSPVLNAITFDTYDAATDTSTFTLEFDEAMATHATPADATGEFTLKVDGQDVSLAGASTITVENVTGFDNKYTLTIVGVEIDTVKPVTITTKAKSTPVVKDVAGNDKKDNVSITVTK